MQSEYFANNLFAIYRRIFEYDLEKNRKIVLYPLGEEGFQGKLILQELFGITPIIIDNKLCEYKSDIKSYCEFEKEIENIEEDMVIIVTTTNKEINRKIMKQVAALRKNNVIVRNILEPIVLNYDEKKSYFKKIIDVIDLKNVVSDKRLTRIGREEDGGYVLLDDFNSSMRAYSFGVADDVSWEKELVERTGMYAFLYDPTIANVPEEHAQFTWSQKGIGGMDNPGDKIYSMRTLLEENGDLGNKNLILKMDVEGAEWEFIKNTDTDIIDNFRQIVFELHNMLDVKKNDEIVSCLSKLKQTHETVWVHGNNCTRIESADGLIMPNCLEILFLNKKYYQFEKCKYHYSIDLDRANKPDVEDIALEKW